MAKAPNTYTLLFSFICSRLGSPQRIVRLHFALFSAPSSLPAAAFISLISPKNILFGLPILLPGSSVLSVLLSILLPSLPAAEHRLVYIPSPCSVSLIYSFLILSILVTPRSLPLQLHRLAFRQRHRLQVMQHLSSWKLSLSFSRVTFLRRLLLPLFTKLRSLLHLSTTLSIFLKPQLSKYMFVHRLCLQPHHFAFPFLQVRELCLASADFHSPSLQCFPPLLQAFVTLFSTPSTCRFPCSQLLLKSIMPLLPS